MAEIFQSEKLNKCIWYQVCSCKKSIIFSDGENTEEFPCQACIDGNTPRNQVKTLDYPFHDVQELDFDMVMIPSKGSFLEGFNNSTGLHMAIVHRGRIIEYTRDGISITDTSKCHPRWTQCLALNILDRLTIQHQSNSIETYLMSDYANSVINLLKNDFRWTVSNFHEQTNNCFDFSFTFLMGVLKSILDSHTNDVIQNQARQLTNLINDKISFCHTLVMRKTKLMTRYVLMYRKLTSGVSMFPCDDAIYRCLATL